MDKRIKQILRAIKQCGKNPTTLNIDKLFSLIKSFDVLLPCPKCGKLHVRWNGWKKYKNGKGVRREHCKNCDLNFTYLTLLSKEIKENYPKCGKCKSNNIVRTGFRKNKISNKQKFRCNKCGAWFSSSKYSLAYSHLTFEEMCKGVTDYILYGRIHPIFCEDNKHAPSTIMKGIETLALNMKNYFHIFKPAVSDIVVIDELHTKENDERSFDGVAKDPITKIVLSSQHTKVLNTFWVYNMLSEVRENAGKVHKFYATDDCNSYYPALQLAYSDQYAIKQIFLNREPAGNNISEDLKKTQSLLSSSLAYW